MSVRSDDGCNTDDRAVGKHLSYARHPRLTILGGCVEILEDIKTAWRDRDGCRRPRTGRAQHRRDLALRRDPENRTATGSRDEDGAVRTGSETAQVRFASRFCARDSDTVGDRDT